MGENPNSPLYAVGRFRRVWSAKALITHTTSCSLGGESDWSSSRKSDWSSLIGQCSFDPPLRPLKVIGNVRLYRAPPQLPQSVSRARSCRSLSLVVSPERAVPAVSLQLSPERAVPAVSLQLCLPSAQLRQSLSLVHAVVPELCPPSAQLRQSLSLVHSCAGIVPPERAVPAVSLQLCLPSAQFPQSLSSWASRARSSLQSLSSCASRARSSRSLSPVVPPERAVPAVSLQLCLRSAQFPQSSISQLYLRRWSAPSLCEWACRVRLCGKL